MSLKYYEFWDKLTIHQNLSRSVDILVDFYTILSLTTFSFFKENKKLVILISWLAIGLV